jgi:hypothetical protein
LRNQWRGLSSWDSWMNIWSKFQIPKIKTNTISIWSKWRGRNNYQNIWKLLNSSLTFVFVLLLSLVKIKSMKWNFSLICAKPNILKNLRHKQLQIVKEESELAGKYPTHQAKFDMIRIKVQIFSLRGKSLPSYWCRLSPRCL